MRCGVGRGACGNVAVFSSNTGQSKYDTTFIDLHLVLVAGGRRGDRRSWRRVGALVAGRTPPAPQRTKFTPVLGRKETRPAARAAEAVRLYLPPPVLVVCVGTYLRYLKEKEKNAAPPYCINTRTKVVFHMFTQYVTPLSALLLSRRSAPPGPPSLAPAGGTGHGDHRKVRAGADPTNHLPVGARCPSNLVFCTATLRFGSAPSLFLSPSLCLFHPSLHLHHACVISCTLNPQF